MKHRRTKPLGRIVKLTAPNGRRCVPFYDEGVVLCRVGDGYVLVRWGRWPVPVLERIDNVEIREWK